MPLPGEPRGRFRRALALAALAVVLLANRCYDQGDYSPTAPPTRDALTLTTDGATTLPADGVSRLRLIAQVSPDADPDKRTVLFSTTAGTLIGAPGSDGKVPVPADGTGRATIELQSGQQVGSARVTAEIQGVAGLTRTLTIGFVGADPNQLVRFTAAPAGAPADGASVSSFTVQLSPALPIGTQVAFQATAGTFRPEGTSSVTRTADASYSVTADLQSPSTIGPGRVTATAQNVSRQATIDFHRALPDRITVATNGTFQVTPSTTTGVTVVGTFLRDVGTVTQGTVATFRAATAAGAPLGFFADVTTVGADGKATATFLTGQTAYRGRVTITVGAQGSAVTGSAQIEVVDP